MSQQIEHHRAQRPPFEAKFRYLADYSSQQSPNLRKQYRKSLSPIQLSNQKRSPSRKQSPKLSSQRVSRLQRFSPGYDVKPARETSQQQFSPYDEQAEQDQFRLTDELRQENMELRSQLIQSKQLVESLRGELSRRDSEILQLKERSQSELIYYEKVVSEITGQIQIVLTKNKILENELIVVRARLQEEARRVEEFAKYDQDRKRNDRKKQQLARIQSRRASIEPRSPQYDLEHSGTRLTEDNKVKEEGKVRQEGKFKQEGKVREQGKLRDVSNKLPTPPPTRRSVGKLMNKSALPRNENKYQSVQMPKTKTPDQLQPRQNCENQRNENLPPRHPAEKQNSKKGEQLIDNIFGMQLKIAGSQAASLKELWKWLKDLGHSHSCLKRWKPRAESALYSDNQTLKELLKEACSYIQ